MLLRLTLRNMRAHWLRTMITLMQVTVAVFLLCFLRGAIAGLTSTLEQSSSNRLWVQSAVSLHVDLPLSYESKIAGIDGIEWVCKWQWFGGVYQDESNFFAQFGVDPDTFLKSYPELEIVAGSYENFRGKRTGCVIGQDLADKYGWRIGDSVPILGKIFPKADGSAWDFTVEGIYRSKTTAIDQQTLYFHYDYLRESLESGVALGEPAVGVYMVKLPAGAEAAQVMAQIDLLFEKGPQKVQTTTEAEFNRQFISMLGNVPLLLSSIGGAVLFAIFFAVLNTMLMAGRGRTRDIGIMKALGFTDGAMFRSLMLESLLLCAAGGLIGVGLATASENALAKATAGNLPGFAISGATMQLGLGIAVGVGLLAGLMPGARAARLLPVEALREDA